MNENLWTKEQAVNVAFQIVAKHPLSREQMAVGKVEITNGLYTVKAAWTTGRWQLVRAGVLLYDGPCRITAKRLRIG